MKNAENKQNQERKRTLISEEEQEEQEAEKKAQNMFFVTMATIGIALILACLSGGLIAKYEEAKAEFEVANTHNEFLEHQIEQLTNETHDKMADSEQNSAAASPTATVPREPEPVEEKPSLTATYRFQSIADIPETLPDDTMCLWFKVDQPCNKSQAGTVLKTIVHEEIDTKITLAVPELGEISDECAKYGYGLISVFIEKLDSEYVSLEIFAFNPEEQPYIEIYTTSDQRMSARMDVQVFDMFFHSRGAKTEDGKYLSSGVSEDNYAYFGGTNTGNNDYAFDVFSVVRVEAGDWCEPLDWALEDIPAYRDYWAENRDLVMTRRQYFSGDRSEFYLIDYLKIIKTVALENISNASVTLKRSDGSELIIQKHTGDADRGDYATITKDGEDYRYALAYHPRVNALPTRVYLDNGIPLTSEQIRILLKFIENPDTYF